MLAFRDINPQAPLHVLFIPKMPMPTLDDATPADAELLGKLLLAAAAYARREGVAESGYRTVINCNEDGGQTVYHLHVHLLAGPLHERRRGATAKPGQASAEPAGGAEGGRSCVSEAASGSAGELGGGAGGRTMITRGWFQ